MRISPHYSKRRKLDKPYRRGLGDGPAELVPDGLGDVPEVLATALLSLSQMG